MPITFEARLDQRDVKALFDILEGLQQGKKYLRSALSEGSRKGKLKLARAVRDRLVMKMRDIKPFFTVRRFDSGLSQRIRTSSGHVSLALFKVSPSDEQHPPPPKGIKIKVYRDRPPEKEEGAFVTHVRPGDSVRRTHKGVFKRKQATGFFGKKLSTRVGRLPIKEESGPSPYTVLVKDKGGRTLRIVTKEMHKDLLKALERKIDFVLRKAND